MSLPPEVRAKYTTIIDAILAASDITQISVRKIRDGIQEAVEYDITPQKAAIKVLIGERFDLFSTRENGVNGQNGHTTPVQPVDKPDATPVSNGVVNGHSGSSEGTKDEPNGTVKREADDADSSDTVDTSPPKKKRKASVDEDAALAARLQAEEDKRSRATRGGGAKRSTPAKKKRSPKKKSAARVVGSDESDVDGVEAADKKPPKNTGFHKPMNLSPALSELFDGESSMSRPQVTKHIWDYIKSHQLQDANDKRYIVCDERLKTVLKQDKIHMFTMTKVLNEHLYAPDE